MDQAELLLRLVALGVNDLRTPLATLGGFARTLASADLPEPHASYARTIEESGLQIASIVEELNLLARIVEGRWQPLLAEASSRELIEEAAARFEPGRVRVTGDAGAAVLVDRPPTVRALTALTRATMRHGALDEGIEVVVAGPTIVLAPVEPNARPVLAAEESRDFGAGAAIRIVRALGGATRLEGDRFEIVLPAAPSR
ncbi:MAG: histidine kinase dimerization/phospho-acceptor domain-containing protein [Thermoleophilia bacterium]